jgi:hypothetical protein
MSDPTHGPIESKQRNLMNVLAHTIDELFNRKGKAKKVAFVLLTANFGDYEGGRVNYISNGNREDCIAMMKELIARFEGRHSQDTGNA